MSCITHHADRLTPMESKCCCFFFTLWQFSQRSLFVFECISGFASCVILLPAPNLLSSSGEQRVSRFYFLLDSILIDRGATLRRSSQGKNGKLFRHLLVRQLLVQNIKALWMSGNGQETRYVKENPKIRVTGAREWGDRIMGTAVCCYLGLWCTKKPTGMKVVRNSGLLH